MRKHVRILGWLHVILGIVDLLIGLMAFGVLSSIGLFSAFVSGDVFALGILSAIGGVVGVIMLIMALPNFIVGIGLLKNWGGWVIILAVVLGLFNLMKVPYGTAIAIYTFWIAWKLTRGPESAQ